MTLFESLLKNIDAMLQVNAYVPLKDIILDQLLECRDRVPSAKNNFSHHLKTLLRICEQNEPGCTKTQAGACSNENMSNNDLKQIKQDDSVGDLKIISEDEFVPNMPCNDDLKAIQEESNKCYFSVPDAITKKSRKNEPNIVNTVIENGEEYVVVKSNWKFNPKKLTDNQKEKLKKKREDIPALYQDLSQSQDEFKIKAWKADSQDSLTSSSKSTSKSANEDVSTILKNMPSSEVVPKIMGAILSDTAKETAEKQVEEICNDCSAKQAPVVKDPKTPRLALKDRVFRNVRNLMAKSGLRNENEISIELNKTIGDINKTPNTKTNVSANMANSAPPKIHSERPSRIIKKPKKFDDSKVFALRKLRRSQNDSQSGPPESPSLPEGLLKQTEVEKEIVKTKEIMPIHLTTSNEIEIITVEEQQECDPTDNVPLNTVQNLAKCKQIIEQTCTIDKSDNKIDGDTSVPEIDTTIPQGGEVNNQDDTKLVANIQKILTPKSMKTKDDQSSVKKKRSRIEKQLMIDMVEGHPLLQARKEERFTRKKMSSSAKVIKRKSLAEKINRTGLKTQRKTKEKIKPSTSTSDLKATPLIVVESQDRLSGSSDDLPASEDIIESSQDSSITTISVKSAKNSAKKVPFVKLSKLKEMNSLLSSPETQRLLNDPNNQIISLSDTRLESIIVSPPLNNIPSVKENQPKTKYRKTCGTQKILDFNNDIMPINDSITSQHESDDISLPKNNTMLEERAELELTENMDTQSFEDKTGPSDVDNNDYQAPIAIVYTEELSAFGLETQEMAEADTEPMNLDSQINVTQVNVINTEIEDEMLRREKEKATRMTDGNLTPTSKEAAEAPLTNLVESTNACSPLKGATQKKEDFLNDTIEISPIKTLSPVREEKSPSPETSVKYVVIKLTSPVQSNGEPFNEKYDSLETFTEEKVSPDKRDQSPPRMDIPVPSTSPSSSLSLKKNRLQMRPSGRAAQMLGLCVPDTLKPIIIGDKSEESEESKKSSSSMSTPARRNLRIFYNSVGDSDCHVDINNEGNASEQEEYENFLKFKRTLPSASSSPAGPILKRKLVDIADETTISPASKVTT